VREDVFRFELTAGSYAGYAEGIGDGYHTSCSSGSLTNYCGLYRITSPYALPYGQVLLGFESGHFEMAAGLRLMGMFADITVSALAATMSPRDVPRAGYERMYIEPVFTARIPFEFFRIDFMTGWPINPRGVGDQSPGDLAQELDVMWYFAVGVGFQFDTIEREPEPLPEPAYAPPPPVYTPPPPAAPPPSTPPPPADYVAPPPTDTTPPPATTPADPAPILTPVPPPPS
jgi:hypothetical protein